MPKKKRSELAAGLFVIVALIATLGVVLWLGAADLLRPAGQRACFTVDQSAGFIGLEVGNPVRVNDAEIGKIVEIRHLPRKGCTLYVAEIERGRAKIYSNGKAHPDVPFIAGGSLLVTDHGSDDAALADEDHPVKLGYGGLMGNLAAMSEGLRSEINRDDSQALLGKIHNIVKQITDVTTGLAKTIKDETDRKEVTSLLGKLHKSLGDFNAVTASLRAELAKKDGTLLTKVHGITDDVKQVTTRAVKVADDVKAMTADARPKLKETMTAVAETTKKINELTKTDVTKILADIRKINTPLLKAIQNFAEISEQAKSIVSVNRDSIDEIIDNMAQVSANLKSVSKEVRRHPWKLLYEPKKDELHSQNVADAARAFSSGASELDQAITKLKALAETHPKGIPAADPMLKRIRKQIEESFDKFTKAEQALWKEATHKP